MKQKNNMKKNKSVLDTNILIRFLTNDSPKKSKTIKKLFETSENNSLLIPDVVMIETAFVLLSVYEQSKKEVIKYLNSIINYEKFDCSEKLMTTTLEIYSKNNISIVDSYICALNLLNKADRVITFDRKMKNLEEVKTDF